MATKRAKRGFFCVLAANDDDGTDSKGACATDGGGSVFSVIRVSVAIFGQRLVNYGLADYIFLARPGSQIEQFASLAAEGEVGVRDRVGWFAANGTLEFHMFPGIRLTRMI